ncbi:PadR family transcriptional regulator [Nocardia implantans]|uniref:PadR family transcriptional regulator n=1 Tax=Nocardia implantans TaxID=3108168 RepID=A0ABU6AP60_9NOCA|nr:MULTISPECIES: PadR family transcriptional regulator [unclassified Nocardia]MBF6189600.1 PadR family transcriptional regulator [Nocardia beijingensis]MEA3527172.1 PadR family transcriptional regulator [Nocardia sp. CDC192]MEB3509250.1 PadR family transcriptional regulator [Nocardia sp. CDC186]
MKKRKVDNLLALAVLSVIIERPMHRYEIAQTLRERGKDHDMAIKWGSLYTVVQNMAKVGFLEVVGSEREGARPERVIYRITDAGRAEMADWTRELLSTPEPEHHRFVAGLSILAVLPPAEVVELLGTRLEALERTIATVRRELGELAGTLPRLFIIESEFGLAMLEAEAAWTRSLRAELTEGTFPGLAQWREWHERGMLPSDVDEMVERGMAEN